MRLPKISFWMVPTMLAAWGIMNLVAAEAHRHDVQPAPPGQVQAQAVPSPATPPAVVHAFDRSRPTRIVISSVWINAQIEQIGLKADGTIETPSYARAKNAAWYKLGASPGEVGPAVILGHVDTKSQRAVFFDLRRVKPGATVEITRADGRTLLFTVDTVEQFPKTAFPTERVYGSTAHPALRLITCGGQFDRVRKEWSDNIIVFASLAA